MNRRMLVLSACAAVCLVGCGKPPARDQTAAAAAATESGGCGVTLVRTDAMDAPEKHAWNLFMVVNHPAQDIKKARGEADCSKALGAPGTTSVWETWRLARTEVFLSNGAEPPAWEDTSLESAVLGKTPDPIPSPHNPPPPPPAGAMGIELDVAPGQGVFAGRGGIGETHMNKATYQFVKANCLWSFDGLSRYSKAVVDGRKPPITLPPESQEVKAVWVKFTPADLQAGRARTYYTAVAAGATYGLVSFHILTKDVPNWFWATFHHKDNPKNLDETTSTYPTPAPVKGTVWDNYVLGGIQTDFTTPHGKPTKLSDHYIEFEFTNSSCITCHAAAHGHPEPARSANGKLARDPRGGILAAGEGPLQTEGLGVPDPAAFERNGAIYFVQTDFLWSIPFRAREEQAPPPARCNF